MKTALVFVCIANVDPYVNALSYLDEKQDGPRVTFVAITGAGAEAPGGMEVRITGAFEKLSRNMMDVYDEKLKRRVERAIEIEDHARLRYKGLSEKLQVEASSVLYRTLDELERYISERVDAVGRDKLIVDVTGLTKVHAARVMLICLARRQEVHTFDLRKAANRERPDLSLYHALEPGSYSYECLTRDRAVQTSIGRLIPRRTVLWAAMILALLGTAGVALTLLVQPTNIVLGQISVIANVLGIIGFALQAATAKDSQQ
jgi:hypothetical protein